MRFHCLFAQHSSGTD